MRKAPILFLCLLLAGRALALGLPLPPWPPPPPSAPPPPDPSPALYRRYAPGPGAYLLTLAAEPPPPTLKSGKPSTIKARPHDIVQAPGDRKPIEGTIRRQLAGRIWFYDLKGIGHPKNPLKASELLVLERRAATVEEACRERSRRAGKDPDAHLALAQECLDGELLPQAEAELRLALKLEPKHLAARLKLADLYAAQGRLDAEAGVYRSALAAGLEAPEVHRRLAERCLALGLFETAARHFARALALVGNCSADEVAGGKTPAPTRPEALALVRRVAECWLFARGAGAEKLIARLLAARSDDPPTRNLRAVADILAGRPDKARQTLLWLARTPKPPASARNNLGALLLASGDVAGALAEFDACLALAPHHLKALSNTALAHAVAGRLPEAEKALSRLEALRPPRSLGCLLALGYVREREGRADEALAAWSEALKLDRCSAAALLGAARCLLAQGKPELAEEKLQTLLVLAPRERRALRLLALSRSEAGQLKQAAAAFDRLVARGPEPGDLVRGALARLRLPGGAARAESLLAEAARRAPGEPYVLAARACLAASKGAEDQAEQLLIQASHLKPQEQLKRYLGDALARLRSAHGETAAAVRFGPAAPPEGWGFSGSGEPKLEVVGGTLKLEGHAAARTHWQLARTVAASRQAEDGGEERLLRLAAVVGAPLANQATVGLRLSFGAAALELALRTERKRRVSRRLAYRIIRNQAASPWVDLPGTVAVEEFRLGLGFSPGAGPVLEARLDGKPAGGPIPLDELAHPPGEFGLAVFAEAEPGAECFVVVRRLEVLWRKLAAQPEGPRRKGPEPKGPEPEGPFK